MKHLFEIGQCGGIACGKTFKDDACKLRLVAGYIRDGQTAANSELID